MTNLKIKRFEETIILSLLGTWFIWFTGEPTPSGNECIIIFCMMLLMVCFARWLSGFGLSKKQDQDTKIRVRMSYSMKASLLSVILTILFTNDILMQEYVRASGEVNKMVGFAQVFYLLFISALKAGMSIHIFGMLVLYFIPQQKSPIQIVAMDREKTVAAVSLIAVATFCLIINHWFEVIYPNSLIEMLILSLIIAVTTRPKAIPQSMKDKKVV
ncbi:hypothetical protein OAP56_00115 [Rickettsiaceae bacterium]|nr:hypothetical protein [Rickettsiaceae bacterium]